MRGLAQEAGARLVDSRLRYFQGELSSRGERGKEAVSGLNLRIEDTHFLSIRGVDALNQLLIAEADAWRAVWREMFETRNRAKRDR